MCPETAKVTSAGGEQMEQVASMLLLDWILIMTQTPTPKALYLLAFLSLKGSKTLGILTQIYKSCFAHTPVTGLRLYIIYLINSPRRGSMDHQLFLFENIPLGQTVTIATG
jgi:hypothetical protein